MLCLAFLASDSLLIAPSLPIAMSVIYQGFGMSRISQRLGFGDLEKRISPPPHETFMPNIGHRKRARNVKQGGKLMVQGRIA